MDAATKKQRIEQLKKGLEVGKKLAKKAGKIGAKVGKKAAKQTLKATVKTLRAGYKGAKAAQKKYKSLDKDTKRILHRGLLVAGGTLAVAGTVYMSRNQGNADSHNPQVQQKNDSIKTRLTQTYKITDAASFQKLYEDALPLIELSMTPIEIYKSKAYDDRSGANPNTIGIGSFWYPKDGNPQSSDWEKADKYFKKHPDLEINFAKALDLVDGWFRYRENGRVYKRMFKELQGAELTLHQFAACATCTYNSEKLGFQFCAYVKDNYKNPVACAHKLTTLDPADASCIDGILVRHTAEACMFMYPEYAEAIYSFKMKDAINSKGRPYTVTSVNQTTPAECRQVKADLAQGQTTLLNQHKNRIMKYMCKGGYTVADLVQKSIHDDVRKDELLCFMGEGGRTVSFAEKQADMTYEQALQAYKEENYTQALEGFQQLRANGYDGADLRCDIALVQYKLGNYQACIDECRAVLNTGEEYLYPSATYNAGKAYEALHNYERAKLNYSRSLIMAEKNKMDDKYKNVYKNAVHRIDSILQENQPEQTNPKRDLLHSKNSKTGTKTKSKSQKHSFPQKTKTASGKRSR